MTAHCTGIDHFHIHILGVLLREEQQSFYNRNIGLADIEHHTCSRVGELAVHNDNIPILQRIIILNDPLLQLQEVFCIGILDHHTGSLIADAVSLSVTDQLDRILADRLVFRCPAAVHGNRILLHCKVDTGGDPALGVAAHCAGLHHIDLQISGVFRREEQHSLRDGNIGGIDLKIHITLAEDTADHQNIAITNGEIFPDQIFFQLQVVFRIGILDDHTRSRLRDAVGLTVADQLNGIPGGGSILCSPGGISRNIIGFHCEVNTQIAIFAIHMAADGTGLDNDDLIFLVHFS